ncbi:MAG: hypothetical protein CL946_04835 [Ectothiorhodospiraceae bacterium]|nr:hypothetical protein [Ectothiorhodospiraceae bacterium]
MEKIDYKKERKELYKPSAKKCSIVKVPAMHCLMIDGTGDPEKSERFQQAIETLFSVSYTLKFALKKAGVIDYGVLPLEGLWWAKDMNAFTDSRREEWQWTLFISQPDEVKKKQVTETIKAVREKKGDLLLDDMRFESFKEGKSAQIMHIGPFSEEGPTIEKLHAFIEEQGLSRRGKHHEIYLSDTRRAAPEKWKTVIRQPVE